jgi:hypothetical protein
MRSSSRSDVAPARDEIAPFGRGQAALRRYPENRLAEGGLLEEPECQRGGDEPRTESDVGEVGPQGPSVLGQHHPLVLAHRAVLRGDPRHLIRGAMLFGCLRLRCSSACDQGRIQLVGPIPVRRIGLQRADDLWQRVAQ